MTGKDKLRVVALVAGEPGLATLDGLPWDSGTIKLVAVYTHRWLPKSVDPDRRQRPEFGRYVEFSERQRIPLHVVDTPPQAERLEGLALYRPIHVLLSVSWRYAVPPDVLRWARVAPINLHRGKLPDYAGAEPVRRALEAGEAAVTLTAHVMTDEIDAGPVLCERQHAVGTLRGPALTDDVERVKRELHPLYPQIALEAIGRAAHRATVQL
jgi:methionyl-tRNA formyltransferase